MIYEFNNDLLIIYVFFYRYRSNSLDSILVADLDKQGQSMEHLQEMVSVHHHSQRPHASSATYHVFTQQHHFIPKHQIHQLRKHQGTGKTFWKIETANAIFWMYLGGTAKKIFF